MSEPQPSDSTSLSKRELRQRLRSMMATMPPEELHEKSVRACNRLTQTPEYQRSEIIMVFLSLPTEVDTTPLVLHAWRARKRVLAPKVSWEQRRMLPIEINSFSDNITETPLGLREPEQGLPIPLSTIDMVVVPGLGFDRVGHRIGRGRGFYDRFLTHADWRGLSCGLATEDQVVDHVPVKDHDADIDMLATDQSIQYFRRAPSRTAAC